jgi:hypothetical protein
MSFFKPTLELELGDDEDLLVVATIAIDAAGEYKMHVADITGARVKMTAAQKARSLRMLATAVEAEAIAEASGL